MMKPVYIQKFNAFFAIDGTRLMLSFPKNDAERQKPVLKHYHEIDETLAKEIAVRYPLDEIKVRIVQQQS